MFYSDEHYFGFLGKHENINDIIKADIIKANVTKPEKAAFILQDMIDIIEAKIKQGFTYEGEECDYSPWEWIYIEKYKLYMRREEWWSGESECPMCELKLNNKIDGIYSISRILNGDINSVFNKKIQIKIHTLTPHLIKYHRFYGGYNGNFRCDPEQLAKVIF